MISVNPLLARLRALAFAAGIAAVCISSAVLLGWTMGISWVLNLSPGFVTMKPVTALCFLLSGVSLSLLASSHSLHRLAQVLAILVALVGAASILQVVARLNFGFEELLFRHALFASGIPHPGRPSITAAIAFVFLGVALALLAMRASQGVRAAQVLSLFVVFFALVNFLGYLYGVDDLYRAFRYNPIAVHTALGFLLLGLGILAARPNDGLIAVFNSSGIAGRMARRVFPAATIFIVIVGWLRLLGQRRGWYGTSFGQALFTTACIAMFFVLIGYAARSLSASIGELDAIKLALAAANESARLDLADTNERARLDLANTNEHAKVRLADRNERAKVDLADSTAREKLTLADSTARDRLDLAHTNERAKIYLADSNAREKLDLAGSTARERLDLADVNERAKINLADINDRATFHLLAIIESSHDAIITKTLDGIVTSWNAAAERIFGYSAAEAIGQSMLMLMPADRQSEEAGILRRISAGESVSHFESVRVRKDGKSILVSVTISPLRDASGAIIGASKIARDITESRRIEHSVQEQEARLAAIIGSAMDAVITVDEQQRITMFNPAAEAMFGCPASETLGTPLDRLIPQRFRPDHAAHVRAFGETSASRRRMGQTGSLSGLRANGQEFPVEASISKIEIQGKKFFTVILRDITDRKRAEEELHQQAGLLDLTPVFVRDLNSSIVRWTRGAERLYGYTQQQALGRLSHELLQTQFPASLSQIEQTLHAQGSWEGELAHRTRDGRQVFVHSHWVIHLDIQGQPAGILEVDADLTELRRTQTLQMRSQKLESLGTLAGGIAHDFNNILLAIIGHTRLAFEDLSPDSAIRQNLSEISKATARATDLVRRILTFSRPQEEVRQCQPVQPVVEEALKLVRATLPASVQIETFFSQDLPAVAVDSTQLHQVIVNLATNAYHAIGDRPGIITVRLSSRVISRTDRVSAADLPEGRYVCLSVSDTGGGMDRATIDRIFDPFFTTKPIGQGTGMGLSVVHGIVTSHGGAVTVQSQPGEGTSFHLYFPAAEVGSPVPDSAPLPALPPARGSQENILYVDDEEGLVMLGTLFLQRLGYQVTGHVDAAAALYDFQSRPNFFAAVVTDLSMPRMSGFDLASEILKLRPGVPILMTSGYVRPQDEKAAEALGIARIISKPSTIDALGQALADVLHQTAIVKVV